MFNLNLLDTQRNSGSSSLETKTSSPILSIHLPLPPTRASERTSRLSQLQGRFRALSSGLNTKPQHPVLSPLPEDASIQMINKYLNEWTKKGFWKDGARQETKQTIMNYLSLPKSGSLILVGELPDIFYVTLLKNSVTNLMIINPIQLPDSIGFLSQLKDLVLTGDSDLRTLPESIGNLIQLRTLKINLLFLDHLPNGLQNLKKLRNLSINSSHLQQLPHFIGKLPLTHLKLQCPLIQELPSTISAMKNLVLLDLDGCVGLQTLPACDDLTQLSTIRFADTAIRELPPSLYALAIKRPVTFLPRPWNEQVMYMNDTLLYRNVGQELRAVIRRSTTQSFAQEHLRQVTQVMQHTPISSSLITYEHEPASDAGGLSREFWSHLIPNIARATENDHRPILTDSGEGYYLLKQDSPLTDSHRELCQNIGNLLANMTDGLAQIGYKMGSVFPYYFYYGLIDILRSANEDRSFDFNYDHLNLSQQKELCYRIACSVQGGIFFDVGHDLESVCLTDSHQLDRLWNLMKYTIDSELLAVKFPSMKNFIEEMHAERCVERAHALRNDLTLLENKQWVRQAIIDAAHESYSQQACPLLYVAKGFHLKDPHVRQFDFTLPLHELAKSFKELIEGFFTPEGFKTYVTESIQNFTRTFIEDHHELPPVQLRRQLEWLQEWSQDAATTASEMQKFLRSLHASHVIPLKYMRFNLIPDQPGDYRSQQIRIHTCFAELDLPECLGKVGQTDRIDQASKEKAQPANQLDKELFFTALKGVLSPSAKTDAFNMI